MVWQPDPCTSKSQLPHLAFPIDTLGVPASSITMSSAMRPYRRFGMPHNIPDERFWSLHVHQGRCNAQRPCAPQSSVSTCSRGCPHVHLNTQVHGTPWGDAADRAAEAVYYKATSAGNSCVGSKSPGFPTTIYLSSGPTFSSIEIVLQSAGLLLHSQATQSCWSRAILPIKLSLRP
jgi:hypothetical protein